MRGGAGGSDAGQPYVALVVGEPGVGKTRLLRELGAAAVAAASPHTSAAAGRGRRCLSRRCGKSSRRDSASAREPHKEAIDIDRHALQRLVRGEVSRSTRAPSRAVTTHTARLASSVARAILELARDEPTMLVLDDLQWVDHSTLEAFELLAFALADAPPRARRCRWCWSAA